MIDPRWHISFVEEPTSCILILPGRGECGSDLARFYENTELKNTIIVGITPYKREWYPMPNGPSDQAAAVNGIKDAIAAIETVLEKIQHMFSLTRDKIAIAGFSAGGVMALQVAAYSEKSFAAAVCHGGAILEPDKLPPAKDSYMPILLTHSEDDPIFAWDERYLPMKEALLKQDYNVHTVEWLSGGHSLSSEDMIVTGVFLSKCFKYPKEWKHSRQHIVKQMDLDEEFIYS